MAEITPAEIRYFLINNTIFSLIFLALGVILSWVAYIRGFFALPYKEAKGPNVKFYDILASFAIFIAAYLVVTPVIWWLFSLTGLIDKNRPLFISLLQLVIFLIVVILLAVYALLRDRATMKMLWKDRNFPDSKNLRSDLITAWTTLVVAAPVVLAVAHISEVVRVWLFGYSNVEQLAVRYLKLALTSPSAMTFAFVAILILAPCVEEYLFRGLLQSWLRKKLGPVKAIFATAICFGVFHFSGDQSSTNLPLIITLISFACYLGFLYEKTRSLFAPIFLHVTFNFVSVIRIIFTEV